MKKLTFLCFLFLVFALPVKSQSFEVGLYGGVSYYDGDLGPNKIELYFQTLRPAAGVLARLNMERWFSIRVGYNYMGIMGDDALSKRNRGLSFRSDIHEVAMNLELNLFRWHVFGTDFYVEPYGYLGAGLFHFNPKTLVDGQWVALQPLGTEGQGLPGYQDKYELWRWAVIGGGGVKLRLSEHWILGFEASGRMALTDHLDDVSSFPVIYQDILEGNGPLAARLSRPNFDPVKGNPTTPYRRGGPARDNVYTVGVSVIYLFGPDLSGQGRNSAVHCPQF